MTSATTFNITLNYNDEYVGRSTHTDKGYTFPITFSNATSSSLTVTPGDKIMKINGSYTLKKGEDISTLGFGTPVDTWSVNHCSAFLTNFNTEIPTIEAIYGTVLGPITPEYYIKSNVNDFDIVCIEGHKSTSYNYLMTLYNTQPMSLREYNTALDTATQIKGE